MKRSSGNSAEFVSDVIPAKAGIHNLFRFERSATFENMDSRLRGNDEILEQFGMAHWIASLRSQ
jgi:hypothetical protein